MKPKPVVLIVDDNMRFVDRMIGLLDENKNIGYINVAANYEDARKLLVSDMPDIVLLDINLPGKNGIELLKEIRAQEKPCEVIMITNHTDDYYRQQCESLGAQYFLDKSHEFQQVPDIINSFLN